MMVDDDDGRRDSGGGALSLTIAGGTNVYGAAIDPASRGFIRLGLSLATFPGSAREVTVRPYFEAPPAL